MAHQRGSNGSFRKFQLKIALVAACAISGCAAQAPAPTTAAFNSRYGSYEARGSTVHIVRPGDTLYRIAQSYGISVERLERANRISDPRNLRVGQRLTIPAGDYAGSYAYGSAFAGANPWSGVPRGPREFAWPVASGTLSSPFGMRHGTMHEGVDIAAPEGTPVRAAGSGAVIYVGRLRGYGNVVILQHSGGYTTVYAHNERNFVRDGQTVERGQEIAEIGETGRATGPNLHFEVRYHNAAENPMAFLPDPNQSAGISFARANAD